MKDKLWIILTGAFVGLSAILLVAFGNPANMGFCIACFVRDTVGALGMHQAGVVQYIRPEVIGIVFGAFLFSVFTKEFKPRGGSSPFLRLILGFVVMVGALLFLGCPLRMILRLAGGDLNALVGLFGFVGGVLVGVFFLNKGFSLGRNYEQTKLEGGAFPFLNLVLLVLLIAAPAFIIFSTSGPGANHAPVFLSLGLALIIGALAFKSRLCMAGGFRDSILYKDFYLLSGSIAILVVALIGNLITGNFNLGFVDQPIAHTDQLWNFLGLFIVGWASSLLGGCPFRQMVLAGSGNTDSAITVIGLGLGAAFAHNFGFAATPAGVSTNGIIAGVLALVVLLVISLFSKAK